MRKLYARFVLFLIRPALDRYLSEVAEPKQKRTSADPHWGPWTDGLTASVPELAPVGDQVIFAPGKPPVSVGQK